jgi:predicted Zn-dependent protease
MLEKLTASTQADSFAWYCLAMEYRSLGRADEAIRTFETLREKDPAYVAMYLMATQTLRDAGKRDAARAWAEQGVAQAQAKRDTHALGELESALAELT